MITAILCLLAYKLYEKDPALTAIMLIVIFILGLTEMILIYGELIPKILTQC